MATSDIELGNGSISWFGGAPLTHAQNWDGVNPNIVYVLSYDLPLPNFIQGDVVLMEPNGTISDLIRFSGGQIHFYSDNSDGVDEPLADVGIPPAWPGAPRIILMEQGVEGNDGYWGYTPMVGQPGYYKDLYGFGPATYNFISDAPVPEPTTMIAGALRLLPFGASTIRMLRKSRKA